jgi:putative phage-type endonuclease
MTTSTTPLKALPSATFVNLPQGSPEWLAYRLTKRNPSESAAVMGLSPWMTPYQLWLVKTGRHQTAVTGAMQRGTELEPRARSAYEDQNGLVMQPLVLEAGAYSASLDGMTLDGDLLLEIKCPMRGCHSALWDDVSKGDVPEHYVVQVQHQLMVSGAQTAHLWVFDGERGLLRIIDRDHNLMERIQTAWEAFQPFLDTDTAPTLSQRDTLLRTDDAWQKAAQEFALLKEEADAIDARLDVARSTLVALTQHPKEHGHGVAVTRYWKQGAVEYKKVPVLRGVDLEPWRGKSREEVRVALG